jgi:uncharacterized lipoprotein
MATRRKHPNIKGKGADVFFQEEEGAAPPGQSSQAPDVQEARRQRTPEKREMVTFYLPPALVDKLDRAWIERRLKDRKVQKSHIVTEALEAYLKD